MTNNQTNTQVPLQVVKPDPALNRLEKLVGTWEMTGRTLDSDVDNITGWNTFEWLPGGFFLKSVGEIDFQGTKIQSLELIAYDPASQTFPSRVYSNLGGSILLYYWDVQGNTVIHSDESSRYMGTFSEDGNTLLGGWRPKDGNNDESPENAYDAVMTRVV